MADGSVKPISQVQVGDQVRSRNSDSGQDEAKTVTATIERHAPSVVTVALHDAKTGRSETLTCTPEHPFFVPSQGWVEAGSLGIGTSIVTRAGPQMAVASVTWQKNKAEELASAGGLGGYTVYNLTVDGDHTFFVGTTGGGTWVHNVGACGRTLTRFGDEYEDAEKLAADAARALASGKFPHGVSTIENATKPGSVANFEDVASEFVVEQTGRNPQHYTVHLPNPVTDEVAATFNRIFGRTP